MEAAQPLLHIASAAGERQNFQTANSLYDDGRKARRHEYRIWNSCFPGSGVTSRTGEPANVGIQDSGCVRLWGMMGV